MVTKTTARENCLFGTVYESHQDAQENNTPVPSINSGGFSNGQVTWLQMLSMLQNLLPSRVASFNTCSFLMITGWAADL